MEYRLTRTAKATERAVDLAAVKDHLRIDWESDDLALVDLIDAATVWVETTVGRSLVKTTWRLDLPTWPDGCAELPQAPLLSVGSVKYLDDAGTLQTLSTAKYFAATDSFGPAALYVTNDGTLPSLKANRPDAVQVTFDAGYGPATSDVPANARRALLLLIAHWYENREAVGAVGAEIEFSLKSLLRTLKTGFVAGVGV